jgi:hypothetical protein
LSLHSYSAPKSKISLHNNFFTSNNNNPTNINSGENIYKNTSVLHSHTSSVTPGNIISFNQNDYNVEPLNQNNGTAINIPSNRNPNSSGTHSIGNTNSFVEKSRETLS